jgi:hypothetical protein
MIRITHSAIHAILESEGKSRWAELGKKYTGKIAPDSRDITKCILEFESDELETLFILKYSEYL